jgi:hypothetical protein
MEGGNGELLEETLPQTGVPQAFCTPASLIDWLWLLLLLPGIAVSLSLSHQYLLVTPIKQGSGVSFKLEVKVETGAQYK